MEGNQDMYTKVRELQAGKNILLLLKIFILIVIIIFLFYSTTSNVIFTEINEFLFWPLIIIYIIYRFAYKGKLMLFMQNILDNKDANSQYITKYMESLQRPSINRLSLNHLINLLNHFSMSKTK
jgi:predicted membrane protein